MALLTLIGFIFLVSQLSCMCMFPMTHGQHGGDHTTTEETMTKERLAFLRYEEISILAKSKDYPFYAGNAFSIEVLLTNSRTDEPIEAADVEIGAAKEGESESAESSKNDFIRKSATGENGSCRFQFLFPDAGTYHFNVTVKAGEKSYELKFTEGVQDSSHLKHGNDHSSRNWSYGLIGGSLMLLVMAIMMV